MAGGDHVHLVAGGDHTIGQAGGVLVYVTLFERKVIVLADDGAMKALEPSTLSSICDSAVSKIKAGQRVAMFLDALEMLGPLLTETLAIGDEDTDELPNHLVCIHPRP